MQMRVVLFSAVMLVLMLFGGNTARACDCVTLSSKESFENADLVFTGELLGINQVPVYGRHSFDYVFRIDATLKGPHLKTVVIPGSDTDCDANFQPNLVYRVYARNYDGDFVSGACSGNEVVGLKTVYAAHATIDQAAFWQRRFVNVLAVVGLGFLMGSGAFVWRRYVKRLP